MKEGVGGGGGGRGERGGGGGQCKTSGWPSLAQRFISRAPLFSRGALRRNGFFVIFVYLHFLFLHYFSLRSKYFAIYPMSMKVIGRSQWNER